MTKRSLLKLLGRLDLNEGIQLCKLWESGNFNGLYCKRCKTVKDKEQFPQRRIGWFPCSECVAKGN